VNPLLQGEWTFVVSRGSGKERRRWSIEEPLASLPPAFDACDSFWLRRSFERDAVLGWGPELVAHTLEAVYTLWPVYCLLLGEEPSP